MKIFSLIVFILMIAMACKSSKTKDPYPQCISDKIENIKNQPVQNPPIEVYKWDVNDGVFYYFTAACCDQFSFVYDSNCKLICAPSGGLTGRGDGNCPEFGSDIKRTLIWKDERK